VDDQRNNQGQLLCYKWRLKDSDKVGTSTFDGQANNVWDGLSARCCRATFLGANGVADDYRSCAT